MVAASLLTSVELFAGIGGFRLAADRAGIKTLWANDIDAQACSVYRSHFPDSTLLQGDVHDVLATVPPHSLLTAGFPCQPFSAAGKKEGVRDPRGTLFHTIVLILRRCRPEYFILENVKRLLTMESGAHFSTILAALVALDYDVEWRLLNAADFGLAQNRERVVILGTRSSADDGVARPFRVQPRLLCPGDLETAFDSLQGLLSEPASWTRIERHGRRFPHWGLASRGHFFAANPVAFSQAQPRSLLRTVLETSTSPEFDFTEATLARLHENTPVDRFVSGVEILSNQGGGARMGYTIFGIDGLAPTLTATTSRHYERYRVGERYRRLTNVEYARLQGFPDQYCSAVPVYDQYRLLGNAVPPPLVSWVLGRLDVRPELPSRLNRPVQRNLFEATR